MNAPRNGPQAREALQEVHRTQASAKLAVVLPRWRWMLAGGAVMAVGLLDPWVAGWSAFGELLLLMLTAGCVLLALAGRLPGAAGLVRKRAQLSPHAFRSVCGFLVVVVTVLALVRYMLLFLLPAQTGSSGYWVAEAVPGIVLGVVLATAGPSAARWWFRAPRSCRGEG